MTKWDNPLHIFQNCLHTYIYLKLSSEESVIFGMNYVGTGGIYVLRRRVYFQF